jgi:hypothetical protein
VSALKSLAPAIVLVIGMSTMANAAVRQRGGNIPSSGSYGAYAQSRTAAAVTTGSYGGYSADSHTRALQELADKYRPGW